ncbi:MAG: histidine kinase [Hormoscilla sp. SP12CHS1]|nr:histidine kinase [Hormoscilla sp. SP12CHS1]
MQASPEKLIDSEAPLHLLLFVDKRPISGEQIRQISRQLKELHGDCDYELIVVDVGEQPYLAEHFKLVVTPTLIKIYPEPRQTLTGTNIADQLTNCWPRWRHDAEAYLADQNAVGNGAKTGETITAIRSITISAELMQLSDEIFRLQQEKEQLQEQLQFKDRLVAMLAHDLRNPLTAASLAIETLELGKSDTDSRTSRFTPALTSQLLKHARTQIQAMDRIITNILQAAKGSSSKLNIHPQKMDLGLLCQEAIGQLQKQFQAKSQRVETDIPQDLPSVYADLEQVRQVLVNILDNAIKYTPTGGAIAVSILHRTSQKVQVSICDTGPGVPAENRERIFEDRFRLERDEAKEGYGIGLSLCKRIIRTHYGEIWVDEAAHTGSCFNFTLPVYRS